MKDNVLIVLAGQPNCGKSTVFNGLTGARQHVANYPGVTVNKMVGWYTYKGTRVEAVDLPGTYSLTSYSPEERVTRDFILHDNPQVVVNVMDATNIRRSLYLTFQLLEMGRPVILCLNMMDLVDKKGIKINFRDLEKVMGIPVVPVSMKKGKGGKTLFSVIDQVGRTQEEQHGNSMFQVDYKEMEPWLTRIENLIQQQTDLADLYPLRWVSIKLMEEDEAFLQILDERYDNLSDFLKNIKKICLEFEEQHGVPSEMHIANCRYAAARELCLHYIESPQTSGLSLTQGLDTLFCNKILGPLCMLGILWLLYYLSIVQGYHLTNYTWPLLAKFRAGVAAVLPDPGFIDVPLIRCFFLWLVDSVNALLNYIPIFFILFACIAFLEDSGYMPRMAFIMDRLFSRYGLHGQSTLPMVLGGIYVGGCAVPGVMSCKGIPDERSRLSTILIIPMLNCLAKVPLYVLLINIYFAEHKAVAMFFISTISLLMVLPISKVLTSTLLKDKDQAPFVMEMPSYHLPTIRGILGRSLERVWLFIRKIITVVMAMAVVIFILLQFPGLSHQRMKEYNARKDMAIAKFMGNISGSIFEEHLQGNGLMKMILYWESYKGKKMLISNPQKAKELNQKFQTANPVFFKLARPGRDKEARKVNRQFKNLIKLRKRLLREMKSERIHNSFLGQLGKTLEPATKWAGFNWRVNVALLSAFAAKESAVATLGSLYDHEDDGGDQSLERRIKKEESGFTPLHALALMMFMVLYPPCIATTIAVKLQSGSVSWMLFSMGVPMIMGALVSIMIFTGGTLLGLTGLQAMGVFYCLAVLITIMMGCIGNRDASYLANKLQVKES